jgi:hypothetical protein
MGDSDADLSYGLLITLRNELIILKKEIQKGMDPVGLLKATSESELEDKVTGAVDNGDITQEEADHFRKRMNEVQDYADMRIDDFIMWNEGSSLDTFIDFLLNPTGIKGKDGEPLKFGKSEAFPDAENMPLMVFRDRFNSPKGVAKALKNSAASINPTWQKNNFDAINEAVETAEKGSNKETAALIQKMFKDLFIDDTANRDENQKQFRLHFATALDVGRSGESFMNDAAFKYFQEQVTDSEKLNNLWNIS